MSLAQKLDESVKVWHLLLTLLMTLVGIIGTVATDRANFMNRLSAIEKSQSVYESRYEEASRTNEGVRTDIADMKADIRWIKEALVQRTN